MAIDPVCGMRVDEKTEKLKSDYKGETYYFCSELCLKQFKAKPEKFFK
ncbi:MAG: YHS domain-containing protein [Candidatus Hadarchaeaceae archaeon]